MAMTVGVNTGFVHLPISLIFVDEDEACMFSNKGLVELWSTT
jgi:hypothetical protein